jgi:hypothetical protein
MSYAPRSPRVATLFVLGLLAACERPDFDPTAPGEGPVAGAEQVVTLQTVTNAIRDRYVVVLAPGAGPTAAQQLVAAAGGSLHRRYNAALNGFAATIPQAALPRLLRSPLVQAVAQDGVVRVSTVQPNAPWNLDRIDQRDLPLNSTFDYAPTGAGVTAYVIDTGIRYDHDEFGGRASLGVDVVGGLASPGNDCDGHGTHVAGTIGGATYGVAKGVTLKSVRVFDCSGAGPWSDVIAGVDWVTANHVGPAVANMSLGGSNYGPANTAVANSIAAGVVYVVSAGNDHADACSQSPASVSPALTVGSSDELDRRSSFSNWGPCVDLFAPGSNIESASHAGPSLVAELSGTSMASPHVAGVAALHLQGAPDATPAEVASAIVGSSSLNRLSDIGTGSPNALLYSPLAANQTLFAVNPTEVFLSFLRVTGVSAAGERPPVAFRSAGDGEPKVQAEEVTTNLATTGSVLAAPVLITNTSGVMRDWEATDNRPWLDVTPPDGGLAAARSTYIVANVNSGSLPLGLYEGTITLADVNEEDPSNPVTIPVWTEVVEATSLELDVARTVAGAELSLQYYVVDVPAGMQALMISISGGTGDADLYVRYRDPVELYPEEEYDCGPFLIGNDESCFLEDPPAGRYFIVLDGFEAYSGVTLLASLGGTPFAPSALAGAVQSATSIRLTWLDNSFNEDDFQMQRGRFQGGSWSAFATIERPDPNTTELVDAGLADGGTYRYRVRACNDGGCSAWSRTPGIALPTPPAAPTNFTTAPLSPTSVQATWTDASDNEVDFELQRRENVGGVWSPFEEIVRRGAGSQSYTNTGLVSGRTYQFRIRSCNLAGCSDFVLAPQLMLADVPALPTDVWARAVTSSSIRISWTDASSNETRFSLERRYRSKSGSWTEFRPLVDLAANRTSYDNTGLTTARIYQYRLRACNPAGCSESVATSEVTIPTAKPTAPNGATAFSLSETEVAFFWNDMSSNESSFRIQRRQLNGSTWSGWAARPDQVADVRSLIEGGLLAGVSYQYRVRACNLVGCSGWSTSAPVVPVAAETEYPDLVDSHDPIAWYRFEELGGSVAHDFSGFGRDGEYLGGVGFGVVVSPALSRGIELDVSDDGAVVVYGSWINVSELTVEMWIRPTQVTYPEDNVLVGYGGAWNLRMTRTGHPAFAIPFGNGWAESPTPLVVGQLYHLVGVFTSGVIRLYVNGVLEGEDLDAQATLPVDPSYGLYIGRGISSPRFEYVGRLDEVALYDEPLSAAQIFQHYQAGR